MLATNKNIENSNKLIEELIKSKNGRLSKLENLFRAQKSFKSGKSQGKILAKSKKLLKSRNLTNFDIKNAKPRFLTFYTNTAFNRLQLAFIEAAIF